MIHATYRSDGKRLRSLLLAVSFIALLALNVSASDGAKDKSEGNRPPSNASSPASGAETAGVESKPVNLLHAALNTSINFEPSAAFAHSIPQAELDSLNAVKVDFAKSVAGINTALPKSMPVPVPAAGEPIRFVPMTVGEKFQYFFKGAILSPGAYGQAAFSGLRGEAFDKDHDPNGDHGHFFADAGTRAARSFAFSTSSKFFSRFLYASIFRQDPRYHASYKKGAGARIGYALSRVFITSGNKGGSQFNISFLGGGLSAAYLSKTWEREERKTTGKILSKWGNHVALTALSNVLREFLTGQ